jgi:hypothetical protein
MFFGGFESLVPEELGVLHSHSVVRGSLDRGISFDGGEEDAGVRRRQEGRTKRARIPIWKLITPITYLILVTRSIESKIPPKRNTNCHGARLPCV